ncbi:conjugative transposon protein TraM [Paradesertivirga mongoliensis]|uniref:Conjugative transposon protein TraM n=1 Tax=Paradesertivirga mongoliensis TaxID=2100740 RepID=A0ABW4ZRH8_9SPHI|nr:conjugative transposon protein TraM [Pedobacter mongoliensis]
MENQKSAETLQKRKFLMVLPLLVIPFITMAFWALDGGKANASGKVLSAQQKGFNTALPEAKFNPNDKQDKFSVYETSAKEPETSLDDDAYDPLAFAANGNNAVDPNEQKINERLALIHTELNRQSASPDVSYHSTTPRYSSRTSNMSSDVSRLENLMESLQSGNGTDQEMAQLNSVLEKILDIQHPGRARERQKQSVTGAAQVYSVQVASGNINNQGLYRIAKSINSRYSNPVSNSIQATIHQDQDIVTGSVVKIRLLDSIFVNSTLIPKNEFIYGIASVDGERLKIETKTLRYKNSILPVSLSAFDLDGLEGLYIPGAIVRDASKKGVDDAIQSLQIMTMDPSVSAQVAGAGIQAAKGLFSRKVKQVRVKVKAGYQLLLRDNNQRN